MTATTTDAVADQFWTRCRSCSSLLYRKRLRRNLDVCPECGDHQRLAAPDRIRQLVDPGSFTALPGDVAPVDPIEFVDSVPYPQRLAAARADTGLDEAVVCGEARIDGHPLVLAVMDFRFLGGSLGSVVGELITRAAERALDRGLPLLLVTASGGARMQEGVLSLMQMATVSQAIAALREAGLLTISLITDPTFGGVAASFATNTDLVVVESGARMGFAGPRVIHQTIRQPLPEGFQTAEFLLRHGQADMVVERWGLRARLRPLLAAAHAARSAVVRRAEGADASHSAGGSPSWVGPAGSGLAPGDGAGSSVLIRDPDRLAEPDGWRAVQAARHLDRPTTLDYLATAFDAFTELHGDRLGADCPAIVAGLARLGDQHLVVVGHQKGHHTKDLLTRNFGMPSPAGYRKAQRVMRLAVRLGLPIVTLIDTPGAYPGIEAEEQGQAAAIADSILAMTGLPVPVVAVVTGEGGSGGALALGVADRVLMLQNAVYSVISPEGCAAILWNDPTATPRAARALRVTAPDLLRLGVVDGVVPEPPHGAHTDPAAAADLLRRAVVETLTPLLRLPAETLVRQRRLRFRSFGAGNRRVPPPVGTR
ncbi:acetyl-CoA carboxylase carboxyltransferase subunit alpha [Micromonospora sp. NBC_01796]|uniref:acetyl-CoA carboxylase carboxyltransferase subunit alpha n=1 Tax=Micromonospora sp. NBC_01796 TaxID=2975987 RepID=UPI002DD87278|nr:acetyl-CoA carboxylase carboxyltransferase subunit alpha [Micromonospora sp. NBC_01796]WSA85564.1 acetyl-CoA carboxylase carboxyltransferase subunit alpha [Micromonospora sp. NBC_01796]